MPEVNRKKYEFGERFPALKPDAIGNATHAVLRIKEVEEVNIPGPEHGGLGRDAIRITFHEFPNNNYWPNPSSLRALFNKFGTNTDRWVDRRVPLHRVRTKNPRAHGDSVESLWVVPEDEWDAQLASHDNGRSADEVPSRSDVAPLVGRR
jgi:hypothetical protein